MTHVRPVLLALAALAAIALSPSPRRSEGAPPDGVPAAPLPALVPDPSPLTGAPPTDPALDARVRGYDAAQQEAAARALAAHVSRTGRADEDAASGAGAPVGGRTGFVGHFQLGGPLDQLDAIRMRTTGIALEPTPEIAHTLAAEAWERYTIEQANQVVLTNRLPEPEYFKGRFTPTSVDDLPPVLAVRVPRSHTVVPSPTVPAAPVRESSWIPRDFVAKGVLIGFAEAAVRDAMAAGKVPTPAQADAAEAALLSAGDEAGAARALSAIAAAQPTPVRAAQVISVSLERALEDAARAGARSSGAAALGGAVRIVGFVLEPGGDVRLLGQAVEGVPPLTLDDVVTALATVWRDGLTPGCSLDPEPRDPAGPQHVRVLGVPRDSAFAKTMLEADYAMKRILCGLEDVGVEGVRSVPDLLLENPEPGALYDRFWLCPVPPRPGDLAVSPDRRSVLLACAVQVRTERMLLGERGDAGTGTTSPSCEAAATALSERYDAVAKARPVFRRLEGLFDLVLLARALRVVAPDHPLLMRAAALARVAVDVPASYPGVTTTKSDGRGSVTVSGGCDLGVPFERRAIYECSDGDARAIALAAAADGPTKLRLPGVVREADGAARADDLVEATMALLRGEPDAAIAQADAVIDREPAHARARALRAEAFHAGGRAAAALRDARAAVALEPDDVAYRALLVRLRMDAEGPAALEGSTADVRAEVVRTEVTAAASALVAADGKAALAAAARALLADPGSYEASLIAASASWLEDRPEDAEAHVTRALAARPLEPEPRVLRALVRLSRRGYEEARSDLDAAIARRPEADALGMRGLVRLLQGDVEGAADDAEQALALAPRSDLANAAAAGVEMAAYAPLPTVQRYVGDLFSLPARAMLALGGALAAAEQGRIGDAATGYEKALAVLDSVGRPPDLARTRMEVALLAMLPGAAAARGGAPGDARERVEALTAALEARGDAPVSTQFARAVAENSWGDPDGAAARIEAAIAALDRPDACLAELFPGRGAALEAQLRTVELATVIARPRGLMEGPRVLELLSRISTLLADGPGAPAAQGFGELIASLRKDPGADGLSVEVLAGLGRRVDAIAAGFSGERATLADAVVASIFLSIVAQTEMAMGDLAAAEAAARVLWGIPVPDEMSPQARVLIPTLREQTATRLVDAWMHRIADDPAFAIPDAADRAGAERLAAAIRARHEKAASLGDPAFVLLLDASLSTARAGLATSALEERARRLERVLEVAAPGPKRDRLGADLTSVRKALDDAKNGRGAAVRAQIAAAYGAARTLSQMRALDRAVQSVATRAGPEAPYWVTPPDAGLEALKRALAQARARARSGK